MSTFNYIFLYPNGLNSHSQLRRGVDFIYQRGGTYEVVLTGDTYQSTMKLDVDLYSDDIKVGRMSVVPYTITQSGLTYTYRFNIRPYGYFQNFIKSQHYPYYWKNDWYSSTQEININNPYPNSIKGNIKYGYSYISGITPITEFNGDPNNDFNHYTMIPFYAQATGFTASGFTNTGNYFDYVGGIFQMDEKFILPNFDQELGTVVGTGLTINTLDVFRRYSPMSQFLMDYPNVPEQSETGRFLTESPRMVRIQEQENYSLFYLNGQSGDRQVIEADFTVFEFYDSNNAQVLYFEQELNFSGTTYQSPVDYTDNLRIFSLPCGPHDINNLFEDVDWTNITHYRVQLFYGLPTNNPDRSSEGAIGPISEGFWFYLDRDCHVEDTRLVWLNQRGGYDYYTFTSYRNDVKKITRQTYDNRYFSTNLSTQDRDFGRTTKNFDTSVDTEITLDSDYLSVSTGNWLEGLFISPQVYIMRPDFISPLDRQDKIYMDLRPVQIISTEVETITKKHQKLNKYRITLKNGNIIFTNPGF